MFDRLHIIIEEYDDGFTAYPVELAGVVSQGKTKLKALQNLRDAILLHLETFGVRNLVPKEERAKEVDVIEIEMPYPYEAKANEQAILPKNLPCV